MTMVKELNTFYQAFFGIHINENNINPYLLYIAAADDIFLITAQYTPDLAGTRHYDMGYMTCTDIKFYITYIS